MKILYKIVLFMILCNLVTLLLAFLNVFPPGSLPLSDTGILVDNQGNITFNSILTGYFGNYKINFHIPVLSDLFPSLTSVKISWALILGIFTGITLVITAVVKNATPFIIGLTAVIFFGMINTSIKWFDNLSRNVGGISFPSIIFIVIIFIFGIFYLYVITLIESHTQGDVSDR